MSKIREVVRQWMEGVDPGQIAASVGMARRSVIGYCWAARELGFKGPPMPPRGGALRKPNPKTQEILNDFGAGLRMDEIEAKHGVNRAVVSYAVQKARKIGDPRAAYRKKRRAGNGVSG